MKGLGNMMKQAQEMQSRMANAQERISELEATGVAGGGLVEVTISGKGELRSVRIDSSLSKPEEIEIIEDLIVAAHNDAKIKVDALVKEEMSKVAGGLSLPPGISIPGLS